MLVLAAYKFISKEGSPNVAPLHSHRCTLHPGDRGVAYRGMEEEEMNLNQYCYGCIHLTGGNQDIPFWCRKYDMTVLRIFPTAREAAVNGGSGERPEVCLKEEGKERLMGGFWL